MTDISACEGLNCKCTSECRRFKIHQEAVKGAEPRQWYIKIEKPISKIEECDMSLPLKQSV